MVLSGVENDSHNLYCIQLLFVEHSPSDQKCSFVSTKMCIASIHPLHQSMWLLWDRCKKMVGPMVGPMLLGGENL